MNEVALNSLIIELGELQIEKARVAKKIKDTSGAIVALVEDPPEKGQRTIGTDRKVTISFKNKVNYADKDALTELVFEHEELEPLFRLSLTERTAAVDKYLDEGGSVAQELSKHRKVTKAVPSVKVV